VWSSSRVLSWKVVVVELDHDIVTMNYRKIYSRRMQRAEIESENGSLIAGPQLNPTAAPEVE